MTANLHELPDILEADDLAGVLFYDSKQKLLKLGYSEEDISIAVANRPFDGKKNKKLTRDESMYTNNPEAAQEVARQLLIQHEEMMREKQKQIALRGVAHSYNPLGGANPGSTQAFIELSDSYHIPLFRPLVFGIFITAILYGLYKFEIIPVTVVISFVPLYINFFIGYIVVMYVINNIRSYVRTLPQDIKSRRKYLLKSIGTFILGLILLLIFLNQFTRILI